MGAAVLRGAYGTDRKHSSPLWTQRARPERPEQRCPGPFPVWCRAAHRKRIIRGARAADHEIAIGRPLLHGKGNAHRLGVLDRLQGFVKLTARMKAHCIELPRVWDAVILVQKPNNHLRRAGREGVRHPRALQKGRRVQTKSLGLFTMDAGRIWPRAVFSGGAVEGPSVIPRKGKGNTVEPARGRDLQGPLCSLIELEQQLCCLNSKLVGWEFAPVHHAIVIGVSVTVVGRLLARHRLLALPCPCCFSNVVRLCFCLAVMIKPEVHGLPQAVKRLLWPPLLHTKAAEHLRSSLGISLAEAQAGFPFRSGSPWRV